MGRKIKKWVVGLSLLGCIGMGFPANALAAHTHTKDCYDVQRVPACDEKYDTSHKHKDDCYITVTVLNCPLSGNKESDGNSSGTNKKTGNAEDSESQNSTGSKGSSNKTSAASSKESTETGSSSDKKKSDKKTGNTSKSSDKNTGNTNKGTSDSDKKDGSDKKDKNTSSNMKDKTSTSGTDKSKAAGGQNGSNNIAGGITDTILGNVADTIGDTGIDVKNVGKSSISNVSHTHTDECYTTMKVLICKNTDKSHTHTDDCYAYVQVTTCGVTVNGTDGAGNNSDENSWDDSWRQARILVCDKEPPHVHDDSCYEEVVWTCGEESDSHVHNTDCFMTPEEAIRQLNKKCSTKSILFPVIGICLVLALMGYRIWRYETKKGRKSA